MERFSNGTARRWASCKACSVCRDGARESMAAGAGKRIRLRYSVEAVGMLAFGICDVRLFLSSLSQPGTLMMEFSRRACAGSRNVFVADRKRLRYHLHVRLARCY